MNVLAKEKQIAVVNAFAEGGYQVSDKIVKLKMAGADGKLYPTDAAEGQFRHVRVAEGPRNAFWRDPRAFVSSRYWDFRLIPPRTLG